MRPAASKITQMTPRSPPRGSKKRPRGSKKPLRGSQETPRGPKEPHQGSKSVSHASQETPKAPLLSLSRTDLACKPFSLSELLGLLASPNI